MGRVVQLLEPRSVAVASYPDTEPGPGQVRLRTRWSGISAGTELTQYRGRNPYQKRQWDSRRRLFIEGTPSVSYPLDTWGYQEVGVVEAVGDGVNPGAVGRAVWGAWGHRGSVVVDQAFAASHAVPPGVSEQQAIFARIGAIALNAVLDADIQLGEYVAVFGLGVPGLLATQMAHESGATVIAVDRVGKRLALADELGADRILDVDSEDVAEAIRALTGGRGADVSIELTGSYLALHDAVRSTAYNSRVVCSGFLQGEGVGLRLGEEFHHNRIAVVCSQISGVRTDLSHRWSSHRLETTVLELIASGRIDVDPLVSHVVPVADAARAYRLLDEADPDVLQVVLDFTADGGGAAAVSAGAVEEGRS